MSRFKPLLFCLLVVTFFLLSLGSNHQTKLEAAFWNRSDRTEEKAAKSKETVRFKQDMIPVDRKDQEKIVSFADVLAEATPAVVGVYPSRIVKVAPQGNNPIEEMLRRFYGIPNPRRNNNNQEESVERRQSQGFGSGVLVSPDGYVLTNHHVISGPQGKNADTIEVVLSDNRRFSAVIIGSDARTDIAILKIEGEDLPYLKMGNSDGLLVGDVVFAVGNPFRVGTTVTMGIVSATGRTGLGILGREGYEDFIQTDASINPGNSGGALVDGEGRLVGINTAILSRTGGNIGIGFAIPINLARQIAISLIDTGKVQRGFLGVRIGDLTYDLAEAFDIEDAKGALVEYVEPGFPAANAGIKPGDVIIALNGRPITSGTDLRLSVASIAPGTKVKVVLIREGKQKTLDVMLGNLDDPQASANGNTMGSLEGVWLKMLSTEDQQQYGIETGIKGLVITRVKADSPYAGNLREGMVILAINDAKPETPDEAAKLLRSGVNKLRIYFKGYYTFLALRLP